MMMFIMMMMMIYNMKKRTLMELASNHQSSRPLN